MPTIAMKSRIGCVLLAVISVDYSLSFLAPSPIGKTVHTTSLFRGHEHETKRCLSKTLTLHAGFMTQLFAISPSVTWVLEPKIFPTSHPPLHEAITNAGHQLIVWNDEWWSTRIPNKLTRDNGARTIFHGSLNNAARIHAEGFWTPGSFCDPASFHCSTWYEGAREWLFQEDWRILPASSFVDTAAEVGAALGGGARVFVRPDSPLKEFSGRVVDVSTVTLKTLDHGYYYDDENLNVVVCPFREVGREWRFVVAGSSVVAGSAYDAITRTAIVTNDDSQVWSFAQSVASNITNPSDVYVLDVCEDAKSKDLRLLELNPFGGADLYACDPNAIVKALAKMC